MAQVTLGAALRIANEVAREVAKGDVVAQEAAKVAAARLGLRNAKGEANASAFHTKLATLRKLSAKQGATFTVPGAEVFPKGKRGRRLDINALNDIGADFTEEMGDDSN